MRCQDRYPSPVWETVSPAKKAWTIACEPQNSRKELEGFLLHPRPGDTNKFSHYIQKTRLARFSCPFAPYLREAATHTGTASHKHQKPLWKPNLNLVVMAGKE